MKKVSHHIVEGYLIHRALTEKYEAKQAKIKKETDQGINYIKLAYGDENKAGHFKHHSSIEQHPKYSNNNPQAVNVERFMANAKITEPRVGKGGITWTQLYILYRMRGYPKPLADPNSAAKARHNPDKQIKEF